MIDGKVGRTKLRSETWNATSQSWKFPQTPARVQLSIWPGGLASNAPGTIAWAGGEINWESDDIKKAGYYYATVSEVSIECYQGRDKGKSYTFDNARATNDTVVTGDKNTVMGSLLASGLDMDKGKEKPSSASATDKDDKAKKTQAATVPGGGNGAQGQDHSGKDKGSGSEPGPESGSGSGSNGGGDGGASSGGNANCDVKSFNQNCGGSGSGSASGTGNGRNGSGKSVRTTAGASALAMIIASSALFWL